MTIDIEKLAKSVGVVKSPFPVDYPYQFNLPELQRFTEAYAAKVLEDKEREIAELKNWKKEVIAVENEWDEQLIGKTLNIQLGNSIRANILPKINELQANNNRLREALLSSIRYVPEYSKSLDAIQQALSKTPAQCLQSVINETIEMCAEEVEERGSRFEAEIIRALKDNYD